MLSLCRRLGSLGGASRVTLDANQAFYHPLGCLDSLGASRSFIHKTAVKENESFIPRTSVQKNGSFLRGTAVNENENSRLSSPMAYVKGILEKDGGNYYDRSRVDQDKAVEKLDVVHIKLLRNNAFVTITDSSGNKKAGASSGCLEEMKGGPKASRYAAEATAEHVGRLSRKLGLKSVVMRVNGFTHFKKKKQAILSWREGFGNGRGDVNPIQFIEDTTRKPHNGCRLRKSRRI